MTANEMVSERDRPVSFGDPIGAQDGARTRHAVAEIARQCRELNSAGLTFDAEQAAEVRALVDGVSPAKTGRGSR